jgi:hypothetical protein
MQSLCLHIVRIAWIEKGFKLNKDNGRQLGNSDLNTVF